jgi:hypothetical protein
MKEGTGVLWRIRRTGAVHYETPPKSLSLPVYLIRGLAFVFAGLGLSLGISRLFRRRQKANRNPRK